MVLSDSVNKLFDFSVSGISGKLLLLEPLTIFNGPVSTRTYISMPYSGIEKLTVDFSKIGGYDSYSVLFIKSS